MQIKYDELYADPFIEQYRFLGVRFNRKGKILSLKEKIITKLIFGHKS